MAEQDLGDITKIHNLLRPSKDRKLWRAMTANVLKWHDIEKEGELIIEQKRNDLFISCQTI